MRQAQQGIVVCEGRIETSNVRMVCGNSGRNVADDVVVGRKGEGKQVGRKR